MHEKTFYRDAEEPFEPYPVTVETGLLRIGNDVYSLTGVRETKLEVTLEEADTYNAKAAKERRALAYVCCAFAIVGYMVGYHFLLLLLLGAVVAGYLSMLSRGLAEMDRRFVATMILRRVDDKTSVRIGSWNQSPDTFTTGYDVEKRSKQHTEGWRRAKAIAEAVGSAIRDQSLTGSP